MFLFLINIVNFQLVQGNFLWFFTIMNSVYLSKLSLVGPIFGLNLTLDTIDIVLLSSAFAIFLLPNALSFTVGNAQQSPWCLPISYWTYGFCLLQFQGRIKSLIFNIFILTCFSCLSCFLITKMSIMATTNRIREEPSS